MLQRAGHSGAASAGGASGPPGLVRGYQPAARTSGDLLGNEDPSDPWAYKRDRGLEEDRIGKKESS